MAYVYTQEQAARYHQKVHDLTAELEKLRYEMKYMKMHEEWLYKWGRDSISGGRRTHFSYVDAFTAGLCLEYLGKLRANVQSDRATFSPTNHGWIGKLSYRLCGSYALYFKWLRWPAAVIGAWSFFTWRLKGDYLGPNQAVIEQMAKGNPEPAEVAAGVEVGD